jgi:hypothetical protein
MLSKIQINLLQNALFVAFEGGRDNAGLMVVVFSPIIVAKHQHYEIMIYEP